MPPPRDQSAKAAEDDRPLPPNWTAHVSSSEEPGKTYYWNPVTDESTFEFPRREGVHYCNREELARSSLEDDTRKPTCLHACLHCN